MNANTYSYKQPANHALHAILTIATFGAWAPIWIIMATVGRKTIYPYRGTGLVFYTPQPIPYQPQAAHPPRPAYAPRHYGPPQ